MVLSWVPLPPATLAAQYHGDRIKYSYWPMRLRAPYLASFQRVGSLAEEVASAAIAPVVVGDQTDVLHDLEVGVDRSAAARFGRVLARGGLARRRVPQLKRPEDSRHFDVGSGARVERDLANDIGVQVGDGLHVGLVVQLRSRQTGESRGKHDRG